MPRPCSCGGSNENCMRCYGRGFIDARSRGNIVGRYSAGARRPRRNRKRAQLVAAAKSPPTKKLLNCPLCNFKGEAMALAHHYEMCRERKRGEVCCLTCRKIVDGRQAEQHLASAHVTAIGNASSQNRKIAICDKCGANVRHDRLSRHKRRVHGHGSQRPSRKGTIQETTSSESTALEKWKDQKQASQSPLQPNLDATKLYAHSYREHGKFGSHPSHDGFDDESGA